MLTENQAFSLNIIAQPHFFELANPQNLMESFPRGVEARTH